MKCDVCTAGIKVPARYHAPDCPKRKAAAKPAKPPRVSEASLQATCADWLALDGWLRRIKTDLRHLRGMGVQEPGIPDDCFIRYAPLNPFPGTAQVLWIEWKARDGVIGQKQIEWHTLERARGGLVWVAKQDFEPTVDGFQDHYRESGLLDRVGL